MNTTGSTARIGLLIVAALVSACGTNPAPTGGGRPEPAVAAFVPGTHAEVTRDAVTIHREAGDPVIISHLYAGEWLLTLSTPTQIDETAWIRVQYGPSEFGWIGVDPDNPSLEAVEPVCPPGPSDRALEVHEVVELTEAERLTCFGSRDITLQTVTWRQLVSDLPYGGQPAWLADEPSLQLYGRGGWDIEPGLGAHIDPLASADLAEEGWATIRGHFDHAASSQCERVLDIEGLGIVDEAAFLAELAPVTREDGILWCREQFVITDAAPIPDPPPLAEPQAPPAGGSWRVIPDAPLIGRSAHGAVWTGTEMVVWGGLARNVMSGQQPFIAAADGAAYDPVENTWRLLADAPIAGRFQPTMTWTGSEVLVYGGSGWDGGLNEILTDGAAYDPAADTWRVLPPMPAAVGSGQTSSTWTGDELIVVAFDGSGAAAFDPQEGLWRDLPSPPQVADPWSGGVVWTGEEVIAMANPNGISVVAVGAAWDPGSNTWRELADSPAVALNASRPVWADGEMMIVSRSLATGQPESVPPDTTYVSLYDPRADSWRTAGVQDVYLPTGESVWTGRQLISGEGLYDPEADEWLALPSRPPDERHSPIWTGAEFILWGGGPGGESFFRLKNGVAYRPEDR